MDQEQKYKEELAANGVELPELEEEAEDPQEPEKEPETPATPDKPEEPEDTPPAPEEKKNNKRTIYQEYKEKKAEVKTEKERADALQREKDALQAKYDAISKAKEDGEPTAEAEEDALAYAEKIGADPDLVKRIIAEAQKGMKPDPALAQDMADFKQWKADNQKTLEKQAFESEFKAVTPVIKEFFPSVSDAELKSIKENLDKLSHSQEWHDKDLEYIVFKNRDTISTLVSPKKRGMEDRERKDAPQGDSFEFDPNADLSSMSPAERDKWEASYRAASKNESLATNGQGKKIFI
jgi:hypothetical protein